jgi:hypothetical protein
MIVQISMKNSVGKYKDCGSGHPTGARCTVQCSYGVGRPTQHLWFSVGFLVMLVL